MTNQIVQHAKKMIKLFRFFMVYSPDLRHRKEQLPLDPMEIIYTPRPRPRSGISTFPIDPTGFVRYVIRENTFLTTYGFSKKPRGNTRSRSLKLSRLKKKCEGDDLSVPSHVVTESFLPDLDRRPMHYGCIALPTELRKR